MLHLSKDIFPGKKYFLALPLPQVTEQAETSPVNSQPPSIGSVGAADVVGAAVVVVGAEVVAKIAKDK